MESTTSIAPQVPTAPPKVAACPKCNVMLVPVQVKRGSLVGGLLVFFGVIGCFFNLVGGLVLIGLGLVVAAVVGREPGLMCPNCGVQGGTLGEISSKQRPDMPLETLLKIVGAVLVIAALATLVFK